MSDERKKILNMVAEGKITVDDAERLIEALSGGGRGGASSDDRPRYRYLRVVVEGVPEGRVDVRVPLALIRAGIRLGTLVPERVRTTLNGALAKRGIDYTIDELDSKTLDEFLDHLTELSVDVGDAERGEKVRVFCE